MGDSKVNCTGVRVSFLLIPVASADVRCKGRRGVDEGGDMGDKGVVDVLAERVRGSIFKGVWW